MMRWEARSALLTLLALASVAAPAIAGAGPPKGSPHMSAELAKQKAAAIARALNVPWDGAAAALLFGSTWVLRSGRSTVTIRDDTEQILELHRPPETPPPGAEAVAKEQAVATATHLLKVAGMPADVRLGEPEQKGLAWYFRCLRQTPQGVPYEDGGTLVVIDAAGHVETARLYSSPGAPSPRISARQAKEKAAAFAKAVGLPWDDTATPTLGPIGDIRDQTGPTQWQVRSRGASVVLRTDTGAVLFFSRPSATTPDSGRKPLAEAEAVAAAARVLRLLGAAPTAPPEQAKESKGGWSLAWNRRTPDGIPYYADTTSASVDAAGQVVSAWVNWHSRPPASTKPKISKRRARGLALDAGRQAGRLGTGPYAVTAELEIVRPSDFGKTFTAQYDVPARLVWAVIFTRHDTGGELTICIDAADGKLVGISSGRAVPWDVGVEASRPPRPLSPRVGLALWVAIGPLIAGIAAAVAYLARRREGKAATKQEG